MNEFLHLCEGMKPYNADLGWIKFIERDYASNEYWVKIYHMGERDLAIRNIIWNNKGLFLLILKRLNIIDVWLDGYEAFTFLLIALDKALKTFDLEKEIKFMTYLNPIFRNEIFMEIRRIKRHSHCDHLERPIRMLQEDIKITLGDTLEENRSCYSIQDNLEYSIALEALNNLLNKIKPNQQDIIKLAMAGKKQKEIGQAIGTSQSHVSRELKRLKIKYDIERRKLDHGL